MSSREPYTPSDDDHLIRYLAKHHPMVQGRLGQKIYTSLCEMTGSEWAWTKRHSWQSWRERYKKNQVRMDAKIAVLFKASHKAIPNGNGEEKAEDAPAVKKEVKKVKEVRAKQVEAAVKKEGREPRVEKKQREKDSGRRRSITVTASHSAKTSQEAPSSSMMMPPPAQRPVRTPKSNAYQRSGRRDEHVTSDSYDHELFGSQQKDEHTDHEIYRDAESAYTSDEEDGTARPRKGTTGPAQKQKQTQNGDTPRAPPPVQPRPSQTQALKSKLVHKKRGKKQEEDIFADTSSSSTPGPPRRPPTAIVRVEEGAFRNTIKRPRESAGDSNWPPKRRKNSITNAATVQQQEGQKQAQVNGKANIAHQQVEVVIAKPKPHAPPAVASSSRTRLEDIPPPPRPPSPPRYRPEVNGKTYAARRSNESYQMSNAHINGDNEVHARTRTSDPLPQNATTRPTENKPPKLDFTELLKSRRSLANGGLSSRASNVSSRSSVASHSRRPSQHQSLEFQAPHLPHQTRPSRPRPSAIELASTQDVNIFAEIGLQHAITLIAQEYGFNTDFTRAIYEQTRDLGYTKFMLRRFQRAVRVEADMLVERFPALLWDNREEEGAQMRMPSVEEFVLSDEEEDRGRGKATSRKESERRSAVSSSPGSASFSHSRGSSRKKSSGNRSRPRPSQALESVIRPISPNDLLLPDDISDYEPPGKSRAGTFVRLERRGMIDEAIELEKRRVSGQYEKRRKSYVDEDTQEQEKNDADEDRDRMDVDQDQDQDQDQAYVEDEEYAYQEEEYVDAQDEHEGAQLQEDEEDDQREDHDADADDEDEDEQGDENKNREGSIISQCELEEEEIDELEQDPFADDEGEYEDGGKRFEGLFTQVEPGEGGQDDEDAEDDMYVSQELQPPPAAPQEVERETTSVAVKIEPADANVGVEAQDDQRDEGEVEDRDEDALVAATRDHCFELSLLVMEDNCEAFKKIEEDMNEYDGDLLKSWSLHWATERLSRFI
ncbi:hypothetical protein BJ165DRAFT_765205 [Panaeolus papilionaceus]|nr:hypothetical protein BJ165DRAFT_765205 [Panaeolus papilionaceus]